MLRSLIFLAFLSAGVELIPVTSGSLLEDLRALRKVLSDNGGSPGTLLGSLIHENDNPNPDHSNDNCTTWIYDNTTIFPNGKFRHEHKFHNEYSGFYGERFVEKPYVVHYLSGPEGDLLSKRVELCTVHEWGVVECEQCESVTTHYVFHDQPKVGCQDVPLKITDPTLLPNGTLLEALVGVWPIPQDERNSTDSVVETDVNHDLDLDPHPLLEYFGGAPGLVTASRVKPFNIAFNASFDEDDEARDEWLYDYRFSNASRAVRFEHAFLRSDDSGNLYEDFQGCLYWRSAAGDYFIQYRQNSTGFYSNVQKTKVVVYRSLWVVTIGTDDCDQKSTQHASGLLGALLG